MKRIVFIMLAMGVLGLISACGGAVGSRDGQNLSVVKGCAACHAVDDTPKVGPSWAGLYGSQVELEDGSYVTADEAYLLESIKEPNAKIVSGFSKGMMPSAVLTDDEVNTLVAYIKSVK